VTQKNNNCFCGLAKRVLFQTPSVRCRSKEQSVIQKKNNCLCGLANSMLFKNAKCVLHIVRSKSEFRGIGGFQLKKRDPLSLSLSLSLFSLSPSIFLFLSLSLSLCLSLSLACVLFVLLFFYHVINDSKLILNVKKIVTSVLADVVVFLCV
jgi:hypothetical protein